MTGHTRSGPVTGHALSALRRDGVALLDPLSYPGLPVPWPALLHGDRLLALVPDSGPVGGWRVRPADAAAGSAAPGASLDDLLLADGGTPVAGRVPVVAVGSNASPGQLRHKLLAAGLPAAVPMVPALVRGVAAGVSAHISRAGYVGCAPYAREGARTLVVSWLDPPQLAAVDATEPNFRLVALPPGRFPVALPGGAALAGARLYAGRHGVLSLSGGPPRPAGEQRALLRELLAASDRLRALLGPGPRQWVARAAADADVRAAGARAFAEHGWVVRRDAFPGTDG